MVQLESQRVSKDRNLLDVFPLSSVVRIVTVAVYNLRSDIY